MVSIFLREGLAALDRSKIASVLACRDSLRAIAGLYRVARLASQAGAGKRVLPCAAAPSMMSLPAMAFGGRPPSETGNWEEPR